MIAVPGNMLITTQMVDEGPLGMIFLDFPDFFEGLRGDIYDIKLSMFLMHEKCKGDKSFYAPMFDVTEESETLLHWS